MGDAQPQRFQFHLSTLLVAVVLGGALLGLNMRPIEYHARAPNAAANVTQYGFPFAVLRSDNSEYAGSCSSSRLVNPLAPFLNLLVVVLPVLILVERAARRTGTPPRRALRIVPALLAAVGAVLLIRANLDSTPRVISSASYLRKELPGGEPTWMNHYLVKRGWPVPATRFISATVENNTLTVRDCAEVRLREQLPEKSGRVPGYGRTFAAVYGPCAAEILRLLAAAPVRYTATEILYNLAAGLFLVLSAYVYSQYFIRWLCTLRLPFRNPKPETRDPMP